MPIVFKHMSFSSDIGYNDDRVSDSVELFGMIRTRKYSLMCKLDL